ncbi:hypothetical protein Micbo1qcDRAFT_229755 [Microdochium bolleyi]|uniref:MARVEL domain-containing protein n=1 Tax=Microdochium bolleyi TaxID=196109 RepID=A0A136JIJ2_9PEZI|nr:hypothetical protein Micbo1qcDRAFT_229755 [Microdochium bolleyi]
MIFLSFLFLALRTAQLVFALVVLGLSGHVAATWTHSNSGLSASSSPVPSEVAFMIICSVVAMLSVVYLELAPKFLPSISHPYASISLETTNTLFLFAGSIALAAFLDRLSPTATSSCPFGTSGASSWSGHCINIAAAAAAAALGIVAALLWALSAFLTINDMFKLKHPRMNMTRKLSVFSIHKDNAGKQETV